MFCKRDQDVPVQLDVRDVVDVAVRGQHAVLVLAAEERDLDLLTLVLVGVVLHESSLATASDRPGPRSPSTSQLRAFGPCAGRRRTRSAAARIGPAVRDHEHALVRMALRDLEQRRDHALAPSPRASRPRSSPCRPSRRRR